jgi:hypothetical protein
MAENVAIESSLQYSMSSGVVDRTMLKLSMGIKVFIFLDTSSSAQLS